MTINLYGIVTLIEDLPGTELKAGMQGVVVMIFEEPNLAYEVEFCDENGESLAVAALLPSQIQAL